MAKRLTGMCSLPVVVSQPHSHTGETLGGSLVTLGQAMACMRGKTNKKKAREALTRVWPRKMHEVQQENRGTSWFL